MPEQLKPGDLIEYIGRTGIPERAEFLSRDAYGMGVIVKSAEGPRWVGHAVLLTGRRADQPTLFDSPLFDRRKAG